MTETVTLTQIPAGVGWSFDDLYREHAGLVRSYLGRRCRDPDLAHDLTHETFLRAHLRRDSFTGGNLIAWIITIARNVMIDHARRENRWRVIPVSDLGGLEPLLAASHGQVHSPEDIVMMRLRLESAMAHLTEPQRSCLAFRFYDGLSVNHTAVAMNRSESAVKVSNTERSTPCAVT